LIIASEEEGVQEPLNVESPREELDGVITRSEAFYTRSHFGVPLIDPASWSLVIENETGDGRFDVSSFRLDDLRSMPQKTITAVLECAGNSRRAFGEPAEGEIPWGEGAVGNATWSGVQLYRLLSDKCGLSGRSTAKSVYFEGLDKKRGVGIPDSGNGLKFVRYLPIEKALDEDTIVALQMNGARLSSEHGFPARLVVPGWYAMASVKWLSRIRVSSQAHPYSYFNDVKYVFKQKDLNGNIVSAPLTEIRVKSIINSPIEGANLFLNKTVTIRGKSWSGSGRITRVEIKIGSDSEWLEAEMDDRLTSQLGRYAWTPWKKEWTPEKEGNVTLSVRATDERGNVQPEFPVQNLLQYGYNAQSKTMVTVRVYSP